jgi:pyruvate formate lyase activating enzyme
MSVEELMPVLLEDREFYENSGGGVTLSGGECLMQADFCAELLARLKSEGISTAVDTCGFVSRQSIDKVLPYTDVFLYDLKAYDEDVHVACTGQSNGIILENLRHLDASGAKVEIRIPFVPDYNDGQIEKLARFIAGLRCVTKIRVLAYHNYAGSKYAALGMPEALPERLPTEQELTQAKEALRAITHLPVTD